MLFHPGKSYGWVVVKNLSALFPFWGYKLQTGGTLPNTLILYVSYKVLSDFNIANRMYRIRKDVASLGLIFLEHNIRSGNIDFLVQYE